MGRLKLVLGSVVALACAGTTFLLLRTGDAGTPPAAARPTAIGQAEQAPADSAVLRVPGPAPTPDVSAPRAAADAPPPALAPRGLEEGGSIPLSDFTWKHGRFERARFQAARAAVAERIRAAEQPLPQDLLELHWLDEQLHRANEEDGGEGA